MNFSLYLEHCEGEGVSKVGMGGEQHFAVVSIQIHTWQQVQLGVHPVETPVRQIWQDVGGRRKKNKTKREKKRGGGGGRWTEGERKVIQQRTKQCKGYMNEMAQ